MESIPFVAIFGEHQIQVLPVNTDDKQTYKELEFMRASRSLQLIPFTQSTDALPLTLGPGGQRLTKSFELVDPKEV